MNDIVDQIRSSNPVSRWTCILLAFVAALGICISVAVRDGYLLSACLLFFVPAVLSALFFNWDTTAVLTGAGMVLVLVVFLPATNNALALVFLVLSIAFNAYFWSKWIREHDLLTFNHKKTLDELTETTHNLQIIFEKTKGAFQSNQVKVQRYWALNELARNLAMIFKTHEVVDLLIETVSKTFMAPSAVYTLLLFDSSMGKSLHAVRFSMETDVAIRLQRERLDPHEAFNSWVTSQMRMLFTHDATNDFRFQSFVQKGYKIGSMIAAPLLAGSEVLGLVRIESPAAGAFKQDDARLLSNFADLGTVAIEHAALYRQTIELAITDGLTGLYVQRYYKERVKDEVLRAIEYKLPLCLMMIDVDNFKSYNDRFGHLVGDQVLKSIAKALRENVRAVDLVARYGGEEFSVLLPKTQWEGAHTVAERIRKSVQEVSILVGDQRTGITVSIGVAELVPPTAGAESFIDMADQALYQAKAQGKNCVVRAKERGT